jgi:predicted flap endonuclease-1-like 5' DNA nuclease
MLKKAFSKTKPVCKVTFTLPVEAVKGGKDVRILGDFNKWSWENGFPMKAGKAAFSTAVELETGKEYQFRYLIDNHIWENDWKADRYEPAAFGAYNSVVALKEPVESPAQKAAPKAPAIPKKAAPKAAAKPAVITAAKPAAQKAVTDKLTQVEGIGPKIAGLLADAGITTFAGLAKAKVDTLKGVLDAAGSRYKMHDPSTWPAQAALAAKGDWAKLGKLQKQLKGGKK